MSSSPLARRKARRLSSFAALLILTHTAFAAGQGITGASLGALPALVVTATRSPQLAEDALADVTVIERDEIERAGPSGLAGLLQRQPGIEITRNGGPGGVTGLFLRGTNRGQTIVLIDGVRVGSATTGSATLEAIPLENIERIEILRGPASGLYGADAIGGVVQVFTRAPGGALASSASAGYGTHDTRDYTASAAGAAGPLRFSVSGAHRASRGFNAITDPADFSYNPDRDGYAADSGSASVVLPWARDQELAASLLRSRLNAQFDAGPDHDDRTITVVDAAHVQSRNRLTERWLSRLTIAQSTDDSLSKTGFGDSPFRTREHQYGWLNDLTLPVGALTLGAERREERIDNDAGFGVTARNTNAALALYQWRSGAQALQANVRRDDSNQFGGRTTGGARYAYQISPAWQVTAAASTAFKAPSFNDLYYPGFSNPALQPEASRNFEAGVTWRGTADWIGRAVTWEARAVAYHNRVRNLIVVQCDAQFVCVPPQNVDRATLSGVTLMLDARRADTALAASLDLAEPTDDDTGHLLPRRARQHGAITASQQWGALRLTVEGIASSHRFDDAANTRRLGGYGLVNVSAEWLLAPGWSVLLRGDNIFNRDYELAAGYATGGATVFAALRWQS